MLVKLTPGNYWGRFSFLQDIYHIVKYLFISENIFKKLLRGKAYTGRGQKHEFTLT